MQVKKFLEFANKVKEAVEKHPTLSRLSFYDGDNHWDIENIRIVEPDLDEEEDGFISFQLEISDS